MNIDFVELLKFLGISTIWAILLILIITFFGRKIVEYFFDTRLELKKQEFAKELELHKQTLDSESKKFQSQLDINLQQFNIQYSKLHQERAEVIKEMYVKLIELYDAIRSFTSLFKPIPDNCDIKEYNKNLLKRVNDTFGAFNDHFVLNKIYFKKDFAAKLEAIKMAFLNNGRTYALYRNLLEESYNQEFYELAMKNMNKVTDAVHEDIPPLIEEIEEEFRALLGVINK